MTLDETQQATVREWIQSGLGLSEIQSKLESDLEITMTYMEVRFLVDDLGEMPKDKEPDPEPTPAPAEESGPGPSDVGAGAPPSDPMAGMDPNALGGGGEPAGDPGVGSGVSVNVDQITRAGALASGKVTFSDGKSAEWSLDQMGRLGLSAEEPGYKPPQEDVMEFQVQLQKLLSGPRF